MKDYSPKIVRNVGVLTGHTPVQITKELATPGFSIPSFLPKFHNGRKVFLDWLKTAAALSSVLSVLSEVFGIVEVKSKLLTVSRIAGRLLKSSETLSKKWIRQTSILLRFTMTQKQVRERFFKTSPNLSVGLILTGPYTS